MAETGPTRTVPPLLPLLFATLGVASLILGYLGFHAAHSEPEDFAHGVFDLAYYDLQLFVLGADPLQNGLSTLPVTLQIARFMAPSVTIYAVVQAARLLLGAELRRIRARRSGGHAVVCGDTAVAQTLAARLHAKGHRVVVIRGQVPDGVEAAAWAVWTGSRRRMLWVAGDPTDPEVLRAAGTRRAATLYACTGSSSENASIAQAAGLLVDRRRRAASGGRRLRVYAQVHDPDLCLALQARRLVQPQPPGLRLDFFDVDDLAARLLFARPPVPVQSPGTAPAPRMLVGGASGFGRSVIVAAARDWRVRGNPLPLVVDLVDDNADEAARSLAARYPFLADTCRIAPHREPLQQLLTEGRLAPPDRAFICYEDEELGLKLALTAQELWRGGTRSVVVRLDRLAGFAQAFHGTTGDRLLDEVSGKLRLYGVVEAACDPTLIGEDLVERLAQAIHEHYLVNPARRALAPVASTVDRSDAPTASTVDWERLPEEFRRASRAQAEDIGTKLRQVGCVLAPRDGVDGGARFTDEEVDRLARLEHGRWVKERVDSGWRPGARDDAGRRHPSLVGWESLDEVAREQNRYAIRELPEILADAGFQIIRI